MNPRPFARFPLIARPRPVCGPLENRVADLADRAQAATVSGDLAAASAVYNLAALIASDCGLPDLAHQWCHDHVATYLRAPRRGAQVGRNTLEPLVNLARLQIRANDNESAYQLLRHLFDAVTDRHDIEFDGIVIPIDLISSDGEHNAVRQWLWTVLLSDGTRALTNAGRWADAHRQLLAYNGVGTLMLDGRQVAVIAHAISADFATAQHLINTTTPGDQPWLAAVTACLAVLCHDSPGTGLVTDMVQQYQRLNLTPDIAVFGTRLGLSVFDAAISSHRTTAAQTAACRLIDHTLAARDGYASRDLLAHPDITAMLDNKHRRTLAGIVEASALNTKDIPAQIRSPIDAALRDSGAVIARGGVQ